VSIAKQKPSNLARSVITGIPDIDPKAQALCSDILGKVRSKKEDTAIQKITEVMAECKIPSTPDDIKRIYTAIKEMNSKP
jgi:DNA-directed RNA polymerase subunit F